MNAIEGGLRYYSYEMPDYESIKKFLEINLQTYTKITKTNMFIGAIQVAMRIQ